MNFDSAIAVFEERFGDRPEVVSEAPGRVNLIGEHVDYNNGRVLPFAVEQRTITIAKMDDSGVISARSDAMDAEATFPVDVASSGAASCWDNYVRGMVAGVRERGGKLTGAKLWIGGDLPPGSGMSSSAALCVSTGMALAALAGMEISPKDMALMAQKSEHNFAGTPCGIMDQFASCFGRENHAMLIDCRDLSHEYAPFQPTDVSVLAIPSGVKHDLATGAYEQRVVSCRKAVAAIAESSPSVTSLRDVSLAMLEANAGRMDETTYRRARHVVSELARVTSAAEALRADDLVKLGALLWETQDSLRDDYEVSCDEIDDVIRLMRGHGGVLGARMVGGGFGGVVLALTQRDATDDVIRMLVDGYYAPRGIQERPMRVKPGAGARARRLD
ncbi:MAG TPA: galactokinase [Phycisphaerae bacterium]|nr:galactokinase [Phycisphaerae bacterium]HRW52348.1 galactokinase [Phycisphaerae bacterium]